MSHSKISIVLAEDHKIVRKGLKALLELEDNIIVLAEAENGMEAVQMTRQHNPMIVIMDIALPKLNGIDAAKQILKSHPHIKILMLTAYSDDGYVEKVSTIGVWGFLLKQCSPHVLIEAIEAINAGKKFFAQGFKSENINRIVVELTDRERQVLQLIAEGNPNKLVAMELEISIKTVEKHRQNLMNKLSIHDTAGLTRYAIAEGMIESSGHKSTI
jgi:DNA-binding NarL/FixJ family response regulator